MTLPTQNNVRRSETPNTFERDMVKRFGEDLEARNQSAKHRANLAGTCALTIDGVVDQINEQGYFKQ